MSKRGKIITSAIAAAVAICVCGGTVYAVSPDVQNYVNEILKINKDSVGNFFSTIGNESSDIDNLGSSLTITEEDGEEKFSDTVGAKLVGVLNYGSGADLIFEFTFDNGVPDYTLGIMNADILGHMGGYSSSGLNYYGNNKAYGLVTLRDIQDVPSDMIFTVELKMLGSYDGDTDNDINGYYKADFTLGEKIKSYEADVEKPISSSWTHPHMSGQVAEFEISGVRYSPKTVSFDIKMLKDCVVCAEGTKYSAQYTNSTTMFMDGFAIQQMYFDESLDGDYIPLKFKMKDGTIKDAKYSNVESDGFYTTTGDKENTFADISSDEPNEISFTLSTIMDYNDVDAIIFCGEEYKITERDFKIGIPTE